jgi:hypothetical protein
MLILCFNERFKIFDSAFDKNTSEKNLVGQLLNIITAINSVVCARKPWNTTYTIFNQYLTTIIVYTIWARIFNLSEFG